MIRAVAAIVAAAIVVILGASAWFYQTVYGDTRLPATATDVVIQRGSSSGEVAKTLQDRGVINNAAAFRILLRARGLDRSVEAGEYLFASHENAANVLQKLVEGEARVATWVTVPEGFTASQIANDLAGHHLGAADGYSRYFLSTSITLDGVRTKNLEGYLFPSTYLFPLKATPAQAAEILVDQFRKELPADAAADAKSMKYTLPQIVTIASLVEREAKADDERALIAGVIYNRLRKGMPLDVDASIEYVFPHHKTEITKADLRIESPYNTYLHTGLPPTPIANPGLPSLLAALHPQPSDYYYYVYKGNGHHAFARTLQQHDANVSRYLK
ncbi:MAG: endolytic transglycosylase MltG [Vulcanimicrobiaceae bacterium]